MSYLVLARKYRPMIFGDLVAQEHVTRTLVNAIAAERISHAYLFTGPRGVGKTSTARILARAVNCSNRQGTDPCNECDFCQSITRGQSLDVLEIDGASNRGIDEIRDLRERVGYAPSSNKYKIYIIDEVHMLTQEAFNALLKTLEEPPSHVIFIFATTAPHKVPPTILSRCQRFDFKIIPTVTIVSLLEKVLESEGIKMSAEVIEMIARKADGAMRDALSLCDQVIAFCEGDYTVEKASQVLGVLDAELFFGLTELVKERNTLEVVRFVDRLVDSGVDLEEFYAELARHYRNMIIFKLGAEDPSALDIPVNRAERYSELVEFFEAEDLIRSLQLVLRFEGIIKFSGQQKISLELLLIRLTLLEKSVNISDLLATLEGGAQGGAAKSPIKVRAADKPAEGTLSVPSSPQSRGSYQKQDQQKPELKATSELQPAGKDSYSPEPAKADEPYLAGREQEVRSDEVDLELVKKYWPEIIRKIRSSSPSLATVLGSAQPERFENNTLTLKANNDPYNVDRLNAVAARQTICETIANVLGLKSLSLKIVSVEEKAVGKLNLEERSSNLASKSFEQLCRSNSLMGKIRELFDPELIS
jgi:DNA polymerase-3 subunit gamma/tau